ncbi:MAG: hypothetical protein SGPRY_001675 [Prymnesium sp.]
MVVQEEGAAEGCLAKVGQTVEMGVLVDMAMEAVRAMEGELKVVGVSDLEGAVALEDTKRLHCHDLPISLCKCHASLLLSGSRTDRAVMVVSEDREEVTRGRVTVADLAAEVVTKVGMGVGKGGKRNRLEGR